MFAHRHTVFRFKLKGLLAALNRFRDVFSGRTIENVHRLVGGWQVVREHFAASVNNSSCRAVVLWRSDTHLCSSEGRSATISLRHDRVGEISELRERKLCVLAFEYHCERSFFLDDQVEVGGTIGKHNRVDRTARVRRDKLARENQSILLSADWLNEVAKCWQ